jgi:hypothetical protein
VSQLANVGDNKKKTTEKKGKEETNVNPQKKI